MKPEARQKFLEEEREYDKQFRAVLLKDIPYFHHLFAKYHDPISLEIAKTLGEVVTRINKKI